MFKYYNPHPKGTFIVVGDCVKRAIVVTTGKSYNDVQKELNAYKKITGAKSFNTDSNPNRYVEEVLGAKKIEVKKNTTVASFCKENAKGRFILVLKEHWVGVYDSIYYDIWDCKDEIVYFAYEITTLPIAKPDLKKQVFKYCCTSEKVANNKTIIRIYDGLGSYVERVIPTELTEGYVLCLQDCNYRYIKLDD